MVQGYSRLPRSLSWSKVAGKEYGKWACPQLENTRALRPTLGQSTTGDRPMSSEYTTRKSRNNWKAKAICRGEESRYVRRENGRVKKARDTYKKAMMN